MARTKKEIEEQASTAEPETTGTVSNPIPRPTRKRRLVRWPMPA